MQTVLIEANVDAIRALATSASGMKPIGTMTGPLSLQLTENEQFIGWAISTAVPERKDNR